MAMEDPKSLTGRIIGCAMRVHTTLGPGLLESTYQECLCLELEQEGLSYQKEWELPVLYRGHRIDCGYRVDIIVEDKVILELKSVETIKPIHEAQLLTYLKLSGIPLGLLLNFNVEFLRDGIRRKRI
jgi:GxxExxY protein